jgi:hypothetical protein
MSYGKVISGGKQMSKGLSKGINDKLAGHAAENGRRASVAGAVKDAFKVRSLSTPQTNNIHNSGKFTKPSVPSKI